MERIVQSLHIMGLIFDDGTDTYNPPGSRGTYVDPMTLVPESGRFNPYDYLTPYHYKLNRQGNRLYEQDLLALQYLADQRQQEWELAYESPVADVARQRDAGLNPDLLGLSGADAGQGPAALGQSPSVPQTNLSLGMDIGGFIINVLTTVASMGMTAAGLGPNIQGLRLRNDLTNQQIANAEIEHDILKATLTGKGLENEGRELKNAGAAFDFGTELGSLTNFIYDKKGNIDWTATASQTIAKLPNLSPGVLAKYGKFMDSASQYGRGLHNALTTSYDIEKDRYDMAKLQADPYWSPVAAEMVEAFKPLFRAQAKALKAKATYDSNYWSRMNTGVDGMTGGFIAAESDMYGALSSGSTNRMMWNLSKPLKEVINNLSKKAEEGKIWASMALSSLWVGSMAVGGASYSRSSGPDGVETSFGWH